MAKFLTLEGLQYFWGKVQTKLNGKVDTTRTINNKALTADITLTAADVGAIDATTKGVANGVAELDATGKVPSAQLPSYVDDVLEFNNLTAFPAEGETGKIYVALDTNLTYRWGGTTYVEISQSLALGETETTAYRGDRGKVAYDHSQAAHAPSDAQKNVQADWSVTDESSDAFILNKPVNATTTTAGFMSAEDKAKLDGIAAGGEVNVQADWNEADTESDAFIKNKPVAATQTVDGFMSAADKAKLDGIASGAEVNVQADWSVTDESSDAFILNKPVAATQTVDGFMSAADKAKLDGIEANANKYELPTASTTLGGVKTTSEVADTTGYSACPIVDGVVYYKDQVAVSEISNDEIDAIFAA